MNADIGTVITATYVVWVLGMFIGFAIGRMKGG